MPATNAASLICIVHVHEHADAPHPVGLLGPRHQWPRRRAAAPPISVMNSRRLIASPEVQDKASYQVKLAMSALGQKRT
jgi:hypothetical protein